MSFLFAQPEMLGAAATDLASIGSAISTANAAAAAATTRVLAAGADEVSAAVAPLFSGHAQTYQALNTRGGGFPPQNGGNPSRSTRGDLSKPQSPQP
ncbi:predicted protein [Mycobacterium tuberculosis variant africanum K85]|uniref:PE domain-containing protein n=1 Tax=Mycobacterium tuberculosis variant africanum K85 TaxID=611304 RepID=A0A9P2H7N8_MYCTX|nr:predicted protein [Mycobacterium tuberculosis variant africanum K85]